ncbi:YihY/virulence factor BrkB family protein [Leucobacter rhizosphaerae]|uniref:YihY/virulence factor BrkB family protein n=1 Tax=Leucobacter rhizosphaerae TaxID=2932245 RepID=A0ABY4FXY7_9MICO|nr:YihY/virulence factor BrkB family protein [Leucobacter rhizosphaerae]UOQ61161.1 YihY/virulence factor BrkB family protein [Leucobacter rhizosphaerae]
MRALIARLLRLRIVRAFLRYSERRGPMLADSITYRALFSVFAAVLLGFSAAALWLGNNPDALAALADSLNTVIPGLADIVDPTQVRANLGFSLVGAASLVGLVGAAISAIGSLRSALRILADELTDQTFILWVLLRNLLVAIAFGGLLVLAVVASTVGALWIPEVTGWLGLSGSPVAEWVTRGFGILVVFAIDTLAVVLVFRLLSGVRASGRALWAGAALGGVGLTVLQELSGLFVRGAASNPLLASFAALIALLIWFNLSAQVILIASSYIITATEESRDRLRAKYGASTLVQRRRQRAEDAVQAATRELRDAQEAERAEREA